MNEYDSNRIADIAKKNYVRTEDRQNIDCYVLNTCHIREKLPKRFITILDVLKNYKNKKKPIVLVTGCVAQAENE